MTGTEKPRALLVLTSHGDLGSTGEPTGYTVAEAADPWVVFGDAGWQVDVATIAGGRPPEDGSSGYSVNEAAWHASPQVAELLDHAPAIGAVDAGEYHVVYLVGGHGTMWDFPDNTPLERVIREVYEHGGVVAAVCHGPAALTTARLGNGHLLVEGKNIAAFTDDEERAIGRDRIVPFLLQSRLEADGAKHTSAPELWAPHVVTDGRLVTGQNPASAAGVARSAIAASNR
ncbi:type 1 glutamine amidotransferase domain-containing protein [Actinacidiphila acididurans]|uniref:Type 1 glutamine amidotransferase domain-containing protein n=1 Tax=Actinacidiphila acididurans TaxID=2784346 RepID=A0ABS2TM49_9ACTN|nr:type 1 glutamine amidotransferase domain-containing protein [Actinacidiphila acididurans]MBM9504076.1 type 1 glutamine amidotransferase domain-containing protein [Actinacidiphila acididurans]